MGVNGRRKGGAGTEAEAAEDWDEMALAHYPSILHFADMLASEDYQEASRRFRIPAQRDMFILCTTEVGLEEGGWRRGCRVVVRGWGVGSLCI